MFIFEWTEVLVFVVGVWFKIPPTIIEGVFAAFEFEFALDEPEVDDGFVCWFPLAIIGVTGTGCFLPFPLVFVDDKFTFGFKVAGFKFGVGCADWVVFK